LTVRSVARWVVLVWLGWDWIGEAATVSAARPEIPIVLSSGYLTQELEAQASRARLDFVISRTELVTTLVSVVERLVRT